MRSSIFLYLGAALLHEYRLTAILEVVAGQPLPSQPTVSQPTRSLGETRQLVSLIAVLEFQASYQY